MAGKKVVIIGAGFGGVYTAKGLQDTDFDITIVDRTNHHLFQPLLYQVATASLSPADIATPIRSIFMDGKNIKVLLGDVIEINKAASTVTLDDGSVLSFDFLVVATGSRHSYFGKNEWEEYAPGLKTLSDALTIREKILFSLEEAEKMPYGSNIEKYLTFAIIGGGPTGVEMAGSIAEIASRVIERDYRNIKRSQVKIYLIEAVPKILGMFPEDLSRKAAEDLRNMGVEVLLGKPVIDVTPESVKLADREIPTVNIIWAAGNAASPLLKTLDTELDRAGRVFVGTDCSIPSFPYIFAIGDCAAHKDEKGNFLPALAPVALQQGKYVANVILENTPSASRPRFKYRDRGSMATIGRAKAVALIRGIKLHGFLAWLAWSVIHVLFLVAFRNRFRVMAEWIWYYFTFRQGVRLIVGRSGKPLPE